MAFLNAINEEFNLRMVMIEDVHALYGASAKSTFSFGKNVGLMVGIIQAAGISLDQVQPKVWQKVAGLTGKNNPQSIKKKIAELAHRLYPHAEIYGPKGGLLDGKSDSLLIAYYASIKHNLSK